jgi:hypothetical protein
MKLVGCLLSASMAVIMVLPAVAQRAIAATANHLPEGTKPLAVGTPDGRGPLALVNLNHLVLGWARISGGRQPDLFVAGYGGPQGVYLFRWVATNENGAPVFAEPREVQCPLKDKGTVFQTADGEVQGLWIVKDELVHTVFDRHAFAFRETGRLPLPKALKGATSLAALGNADGSYDLAFEMSGGGRGPEGHPWTEEWRPYNSSGIAVGPLPYRYLSGAHLPALLHGPLQQAQQITPTRQEVYYRMHQLTALNLGAGHERDLATGSRQGNLIYYHNTAAAGWQLEPRRLIAGEDGNALRHPSINPSVLAYPNAESGLSDLIACGEGGLYFYRFTRRFTPAGAPMYKQPVPVLQEHADLYAGTLPIPTVVDWNGDGVLDILVGNSEGFILYFQNIGSNDRPCWLPDQRVQAGGRDIQVQAGYAGSLQGLQESRWGYLSPNVIDWNGDGLPDIITGDITGNFMVYLNRGTPQQPRLEPAHPLYCDGIDLHGMWRVRPAVAKLGGRMALAIVDGEDHFHLYWRIDDYNVEDAGKLTLADGGPIGVSGGPGGQSGRCKLDFFDWDGDGLLDLIVGTARVNSIPDRENGMPMPAIGQHTLGTPLWLRNVGTTTAPKFARPAPFRDLHGDIIQPGGAHETGAVGTMLGGHGPNLLICNEAGRLFLLLQSQLSTQQAK